jgi:hypothetical protein
LRSFAGLDALIGLVPAQVVTSLSAIDFGRGSEAFYRDQMPGLLTELADRARVLSITASSAIEGVIVADADRAKRIIDRRTTTLRNRSEQELAGYRDAQDYLFREDWRVISCNFQCLPATTRPGTRQATCSARTGFRDHAGQPGRRPMSLRDHAGPLAVPGLVSVITPGHPAPSP